MTDTEVGFVCFKDLRVIAMSNLELCNYALLAINARMRELRTEMDFLRHTKKEIQAMAKIEPSEESITLETSVET